jgi:hypothetical protein
MSIKELFLALHYNNEEKIFSEEEKCEEEVVKML